MSDQTKKNGKQNSICAVIIFGLLACLVYGMGAGIRASIGIFLEPLAKLCGTSCETVSLLLTEMERIDT